MNIITGIFNALTHVFGFGLAPENSPGSGLRIPLEIDWTKWSPPAAGDVRSPCPAINALANHGILPHNGKGISKSMAVEALTRSFNIDPMIASVLSAGAIAANPDHSAHTFDLNHVNKHGFIEHDGSLSRSDAAFGDQFTFSEQNFDAFLQNLQFASPDGETSWKSAANARYLSIVASKAKHDAAGKEWTYGIKEAITSYGETGLYLSLLGKNGIASIQWIKIFFVEERLPYAEGWRPPAKINQGMLNHAFAEMLKHYGHGHEEAQLVRMGTFEALRAAVASLGIGLLKSPAA